MDPIPSSDPQEQVDPSAASDDPQPQAPAPEPLALYVAKALIADRSFQPGVVEEGSALVEACDAVLTNSNGMSMSIACFVDRDREGGVPFPLTLERLREIGADCLKYTGTTNGVKLPVVIEIFDVGQTPPTAERLDALRPLACVPGLGKVAVRSWALTAGGEVWSTALFGGLFRGRRYFEQLLRNPRRAEAQLRQPAKRALTASAGPPWVTTGIAAVLAALFLGEILYGVGGAAATPTVKTLVAVGGLSRALALEDGEYYRILTAPFLHGSVIHLLLNGVALVLGGVVLESLLGRAWMAALFLLGALGGAAGSLLANAPNVVSVGASGAIMGLLGAALVVSFRIPEGLERTNVQSVLARMLIPSLIPLATHRSEGAIDYGAHIGGAITGALAALVLFKSWQPSEAKPPWRKGALAFAAIGCLGVALSFGLVATAYDKTVAVLEGAALLIPNDELPQDKEQWDSRIDNLRTRFPRDPRVQINYALRLLDQNDQTGAEAALRNAIAEEQLIKAMFPPTTRIDVIARGVLAEILVHQGRLQEAQQTAAPVCNRGEGGGVPKEFGTLKLCPAK